MGHCRVNHHNHTVTHSLHTAPRNWERIQQFAEWANGYLERGKAEFGLESDAVLYAAYEFDGCTVPTDPGQYETYFIDNVTMLPYGVHGFNNVELVEMEEFPLDDRNWSLE